jgi:Glycosyltransferase 61
MGLSRILRLSKQRYIRAKGWSEVRANQRKILRLSEHSKLVHLEPVNPGICQGSVQHYFHFILDLLLPLSLLVRDSAPEVRFEIENVGLLHPHLASVFSDRIKIAHPDDRQSTAPSVPLVGMCPICVRLRPNVYAEFRDTIFEELTVDRNSRQNLIILIERIPPDDFYLKDAELPGGGTTRRSIPNHDHLANCIKSAISPPYQFQNIRLEDFTLKQQVELFQQAALVVGQHGAGLSNCIWMQKGSSVIEISAKPWKAHFRLISEGRGLNYTIFKTETDHSPVDIAQFIHLLSEYT